MKLQPSFTFLLLFLLLLHGACAARFTCNATARASCQALAGFVPPNATTYASIMSLFQVRSIRQLLGANGLPLSTAATTLVPARSVIKIPFPCICRSGNAVSNGRPIYKIQPGDSLDFIARTKFGGLVSYQDISAVNKITNPNVIAVGQQLKIPLPCSCDPVDGQTVVHYAHVVAPGSSVTGIAADFGLTEATLMRINGIQDAKKLLAGQVLDVPLRACSSSISQKSLDHNLRVSNGSYVLTANNCVLCSCSSSTWQLNCQPTQGLGNSVCPAATCGNLYLGNSSSTSTCELTTCSYTGYTNKTANFTILTNLTTLSSCNGGSAPLSQPNENSASKLRAKVMTRIDVFIFLHLGLVLFGFWWQE